MSFNHRLNLDRFFEFGKRVEDFQSFQIVESLDEVENLDVVETWAKPQLSPRHDIDKAKGRLEK